MGQPLAPVPSQAVPVRQGARLRRVARALLLPVLTALRVDRFAFHALQMARAARYRRAPRMASDGLALPPARLRVGVGGTADPDDYLATGAAVFELLQLVLGRAGTDLSRLPRVLDFGCGCGRVLRHWRTVPGAQPSAVDIDPAMVSWCRDNLSFATVTKAPSLPPMAFASASFDLACAVSVFTHLDEPSQKAWMRELARLVCPGGWLCVTVHGRASILDLDRAGRRAFLRGEVVVRRRHARGTNLCAAYHPADALQALIEPHFEVVESVPAGTLRHVRQDLYLARRLGLGEAVAVAP